MTEHVAFIGLGAMGYPMARHLANAGHKVAVYNRTEAKARQWLKENPQGEVFATPNEAARGASVVFLCVGNDDDVRSVVYGDSGTLSGMSAGSVLVDHTTTSADLSRELYREGDKKGVEVIDAPVSGGQAGAENGILTVMAGGSADVYERIVPFFEAYSQKHKLMGDIGSGQLTKMVNQICIAGVVQGLSEGLHFAENAGLNTESVIDVISKGAASSWQMVNRSTTMSARQFDFGFAVDWMRKDLGIVLDEAKRNKSTLPITALVDQYYGQVQKIGGGRWDTSSLITLLNTKAK